MVDFRRQLETLHLASLGWAMSCCAQRQEAEDVLHTVYIKVLEGRARYEGRSNFRTWLFGVIQRTAHERRRRRWLQESLLSRWHQSEPLRAVPCDEDAVMLRERKHGLLAATARLSARQRDVLHLVFYQDFTIEESAQTLGISLGSARTHFERGKQRLRALLLEDSVP